MEEKIVATPSKPFAIRLNAFLFEKNSSDFSSYLADAGRTLVPYDITAEHGIEGKIYVKLPKDGRPRWAGYLDSLHGQPVDGLLSRSVSAVLLVATKNFIVAFSFGYGRYLLDDVQYKSDFGIRTALNTLNSDSLRSVDLFSMEQEPLLKRAQAIRGASAHSFGIDVSRDILKAVTGDPISGINWLTIHGGGPQYSFTVTIDGFSDLPSLASQLSTHYLNTGYKKDFKWVDNIQRIQNSVLRDSLDAALLADIQSGPPTSLQLTTPEISEWDKVSGFSYTNAKTNIKPILLASDYFAANPPAAHTLKKLKENRIFCFDVNDIETNFSAYSCIYHEVTLNGALYILFSGTWFSIDQQFMTDIQTGLKEIPLSTLVFDDVRMYDPLPSTSSNARKKKLTDVESEGEYNERIATAQGYHLFDKKLVKPRTSASSIEVCDLLTNDKEFIHVKHRKGGSAGLSHLFAQGRVAAELLLSDHLFRNEARKIISGAKSLIGSVKFKPSESEIVFLVLGDKTATVKNNLPFFSKINLWLAYQSLTQRNYKVSICAAELATTAIPRPIALKKPRKGASLSSASARP
jgi:uncharacterized protein (TIGR04141 family)